MAKHKYKVYKYNYSVLTHDYNYHEIKLINKIKVNLKCNEIKKFILRGNMCFDVI